MGGELRADKLDEIWSSRVLTASAWTVPSIAGEELLFRELKIYRFENRFSGVNPR